MVAVIGLSMAGCGTDDNGGNGNGNGDNTPKVVAEQYRGTFDEVDVNGNFFQSNHGRIVFGETTYSIGTVNIDTGNVSGIGPFPAWTIGNRAYGLNEVNVEQDLGTFESTDVLVSGNRKYKRK